MYCWECGERLEWDDIICPECGADPEGEGNHDYEDWDGDYYE